MRVGGKPYIVAEMSGNHSHSLETALAIVDAAADAGVDALKIQTYTADTMTLDVKEQGFTIEDEGSLWNGRTLYSLYDEAHTPWNWHKPIFDRCKERGIAGFSTPFDASAVEFLEALDVPFYKVASFEIVDTPLIKRIARTKKPMIISTGMASISEIEAAVKTAKDNGCPRIILLKCTSSYPASPVDSHIRTIPALRDIFGVEVGLSDHTMGCGVAVAAVALGATFIEKHFCLDRSQGGIDSAFSLEPHEMKVLVDETERAWQAMGKIQFGGSESEKGSRTFRRSLYVVKDLRAGQLLTEDAVRSIRPGFGLPPGDLEHLLGRRVAVDVKAGTPLKLDLLQ